MIAHSFRKLADRGVSSVGDFCGVEYLPSVFNGRFVLLPRQAWKSLYDRYENYLSRWIDHYLRSGDTFIDVGAHFGLWSAFAAKIVGASGKVVAVEPSPAYATLAETAKPYPNVTALRLGMGDHDGHLTFFAQGDSKSGSFSKAVTEVNVPYQPQIAVTAETVLVKSLDSLVAENGLVPRLIKIDVEGFEGFVLRGAKELMLEKRVVFLVEIHPLQLKLQGHAETEIFEWFASHGYGCEVINRDPTGIYTIRAESELFTRSS